MKKTLNPILALLFPLILISSSYVGKLKVGDSMPNITGTLCQEFALGNGAMCVKEYCKDGKIVRIEYYFRDELRRVSVFAKDRTQYTDERDKYGFPFPDGIVDFAH